MTFFPESGVRDAFGATAPADADDGRLSLRQRAGAFWLRALFNAVNRAPGLARLTTGFWVRAAWMCSPALRQNTLHNAARLLYAGATAGQQRRLARDILRHFFLFVQDIGRYSRLSVQEISAGVESITGQANYDAARQLKSGVILATAHFGGYEAALAALAQREARMHVVFRRDRFGAFEQMRSKLHERLGVIEVPIDAGIAAWVAVREALRRDEAVLMQADRVMPGQRGVAMPMCGGRIEMPLGPAKLASMTGAPILPVFAVRLPDGRVRVEIQPPIVVGSRDMSELMPAVARLTAIIEQYVRRYPQQWLVLHRPWIGEGAGR